MDEQVGNFFTEFGDAEGRTNFALWSLMTSPLLRGTDLTNMSAATLATVTNKAAIAVNKDGLAEQGLLRTNTWQPGNKHSPSSAHALRLRRLELSAARDRAQGRGQARLRTS